MKGFTQAQSNYDRMLPDDNESLVLYAEQTSQNLPIPDWMTDTMRRHYINDQEERILNGWNVQDAEDWHSDVVEYCTCSFCKDEWQEEYAESMEVLKQENKTTWR